MPPHPTAQPPAPRTARKRQAILEAATQVFLSEGFAGASMDAVAAAAGVSKPTVYNHFADKQQLFEQIVRDMIEGIARPFYDQLLSLGETRDLENSLCGIAYDLLAAVMQPPNLQLRRLVIGESSRFPELGHAYEKQGPGRAVSALTDAIARLAEQGTLRVDDPCLAAAQLNWLIVSVPLNHAMLTGTDRSPGRATLRGYADSAVRLFLAGYGTSARP